MCAWLTGTSCKWFCSQVTQCCDVLPHCDGSLLKSLSIITKGNSLDIFHPEFISMISKHKPSRDSFLSGGYEANKFQCHVSSIQRASFVGIVSHSNLVESHTSPATRSNQNPSSKIALSNFVGEIRYTLERSAVHHRTNCFYHFA